MRALWSTILVCVRMARADDVPIVRSRAAVALDAASGTELFAKDADEIRPVASTARLV